MIILPSLPAFEAWALVLALAGVLVLTGVLALVVRLAPKPVARPSRFQWRYDERDTWR